MNRYLRFLLLILIVAPLAGVNGQINFREGRIITTQNDTLFGLIKDGRTPRNLKVCLFKENKHSKAVKYYPDDIKSYKIIEGKYYASQLFSYEGAWNHVFADVLVEGNMNLYYFRRNKSISYYLENEDRGMIGLINRDKEIKLTSNWGHTVYSNYEDVKIPIYKDTLLSLSG